MTFSTSSSKATRDAGVSPSGIGILWVSLQVSALHVSLGANPNAPNDVQADLGSRLLVVFPRSAEEAKLVVVEAAAGTEATASRPWFGRQGHTTH
jgi:hypothetical protein